MMEKNITFYYNKKLVYIKIFILSMIAIFCGVMAFKLENIDNTFKLIKYIYIALMVTIFGIFFYVTSIYGDILDNKIIEISSEGLTYFYFF